MQQIVIRQFPGVLLLLKLNADRLFAIGTILAGLLAGAFLGTAIIGH